MTKHEEWLHEPKYAANLERALEWDKTHARDETDLDVLERRLRSDDKHRTSIVIRPPLSDAELAWLRDLWQAEWGGQGMVSRGRVYHLADLDAWIALNGETCVGAATVHRDDDGDIELMSLNAVVRGGGIGTQLLEHVEVEAARAGARRVWLITSNDNLDAVRFYQRRGYRMVAVHVGAIDEARALKPTIPLLGEHGIEIHDEIELAKILP